MIKSSHGSHLFNCPGCGIVHGIDNTWQYNNNPNSPTVYPSILVKWTEGEERKECVCHSFIKDGNIKFLSDCTHELAGQTVMLERYVKNREE